MAVLDTLPTRTQAPAARRQPWLALGLALFCAASYAVALVLPYYANDLQHRPAGESLYLHEMSGLWPYDSAFGWLVGLMGMFALMAAPFVAAGVVGWAALRLWTERHDPGLRWVWVAATVVSLSTLAWLTTPLAGELLLWFLD